MENKEPEKKWDVPAKGESWTADQLANYLGLVYNPKFDEPEKGEHIPPYLLDPKGALIQGCREQVVQFYKAVNKPPKEPAIVVPGMLPPPIPLRR